MALKGFPGMHDLMPMMGLDDEGMRRLEERRQQMRREGYGQKPTVFGRAVGLAVDNAAQVVQSEMAGALIEEQRGATRKVRVIQKQSYNADDPALAYLDDYVPGG